MLVFDPCVGEFLSVREAVSTINACVDTGNKTKLLRALQSEEAQLKGVIPENMQWYSDILSKTKKDGEEVSEVCPQYEKGGCMYTCLPLLQHKEGVSDPQSRKGVCLLPAV